MRSLREPLHRQHRFLGGIREVEFTVQLLTTAPEIPVPTPVDAPLLTYSTLQAVTVPPWMPVETGALTSRPFSTRHTESPLNASAGISSVLAFSRGRVRCWVNFGPDEVPLPAGWRVVVSSLPEVEGVLPVDTAVWLEPDDGAGRDPRA